MTAPRRRTLWKVLAAVVTLLAGLVAIGLVVSSSPAVCSLCHDKQAKALAGTTHKEVGCYSCHLPAGGWSAVDAKADEVFSMYPAFLLGRRTTGPGSRVSRGACLGCHGEVLTTEATGTPIRILHAKCAASPERCDTCHGDSGHPGTARWTRKLDMDACIGCHAVTGATLSCDGCHKPRLPSDRLTKGTMAVSHGANWKQAHGMADLRTCGACHDKDFCVRCHGTRLPHPVGFLATHGKEALVLGAKCASCHQATKMCDTCHGIAMPHPVDFRRQHTRVADSPADPRCLKCHRDFDCVNCHVRHTHPGGTDGTLGSSKLPSVTVSR